MLKKIVKNKFFQIGLMALGFSLAGGVLALVITENALNSSQWPFTGAVDLSSSLNNGNVIIREPRNVIVQENVKTNETASTVSGSLAGIFKKKDAKAKTAGSDLSKYYLLDQEQAQGIILTSDGWILVKNFEADAKNIVNNYSAVTRDKKIYAITQVVFDKLSGYTFLKIQANGLDVPSFSSLGGIYPGLTVLAVSWDGGIFSASVSEVKGPGGLIKSADYNPREIILNAGVRDDFKGAFLFSLSGDLAGFVTSSGQIEHINNFLPAVQSLLKLHAVKRTSIGLYYINLKDLAGYPLEKGALIVKGSDGLAIKKDSPAAKAGLAEGDVILAVNGLEIDKNNDLEAVLAQYNIGDKIKLKITGPGADLSRSREAEITIGELK